jgi:hypothetical protein
MRETIPQLPNMPSWRGVQLKHRDNSRYSIYVFIMLSYKSRDTKMTAMLTQTRMLVPLFPGLNLLEREADHSSPPNVVV